MTKLEKQIIDIFKNNLKDKKIKKNSTIQNTEGWDSLNHVNIVSEVSKKFSIKISFNEMVNINSVRNIISLVKKKL